MGKKSKAYMKIAKQTKRKYTVSTYYKNTQGNTIIRDMILGWHQIVGIIEATASAVKKNGTIKITFEWTREEACND